MSESQGQNKITDQEYYSQMLLKGILVAGVCGGVFYSFLKFILKVV